MVDNSTSAGIVDAEDRISALPDFLIHHIMSFLKIKDVIETRKLSRRWRPLWRSTPVLDFTGWHTAHSVIDRFLTVYEGEKIQRFQASIFYEYDNIFESWVQFSVEHNVYELDIQFFKYGRWGIMELYKMPDHHFNYAGLRVLKLSNCDLNVHPPFCLPSLALLHLCSVGVIHLDTSGCPSLENLILEECKGNLDLYAPNQNLRYLMMKDSGESSIMALRSMLLTLCPLNLLSI